MMGRSPRQIIESNIPVSRTTLMVMTRRTVKGIVGKVGVLH